MNKENIPCSQNGKWSPVVCSKMDDTEGHNMEWSEPEKDNSAYSSLYIGVKIKTKQKKSSILT